MLYIYRNEITPDRQLPPEAHRTTIGEADWAKSAGRLMVRNVGRDLIVAAHNVIACQGVLACFMPGGQGGEKMFGKLFTVVRNLGPRHATDVWVGGMACHDSPQPYSIDTARSLAYGRMGRVAPEEGTLRSPEWNDMAGSTWSVELNTAMAILTIQETAS